MHMQDFTQEQRDLLVRANAASLMGYQHLAESFVKEFRQSRAADEQAELKTEARTVRPFRVNFKE